MAAVLPEQLLRAFTRHDSARVSEIVRAMTDKERRAIMPLVTARARAIGSWSDEAGPLLVAGLACSSTPAQAATWLHRRSLRWAFGFGRDTVVRVEAERVIAIRDENWLIEFATRIADGLSKREPMPNPGMWEFIADLVVRCGAPIPTGAAFVRGWARKTALSDDVACVAADPLLPSMLPRLFDLDGMGAHVGITRWRASGTESAPSIIGRLVLTGRIDRAHVLAGVLSRLRLGDDAASIRYFVKLHNELGPTTDETAPMVDEYIALLAQAPGTVAALAQKVLRALDEAKAVRNEDLITASAALLSRPEATVVKAQLSWLAKALRRDQSSDLVATVSAAFEHPQVGVAERALTMAIQYAAALDTAGRDRIAEAAARLPADLRARAAAVFTVAAVNGEAPIALVPAPRRSMPPPIETPAELAGAVVAHIVNVSRDSMSSIDLERLLDGLIRLAWRDRAAVLDALGPIRERHPDAFDAPEGYASGRSVWLPGHVGGAIGAVFPDDPSTHARRAAIIRRSTSNAGLDYRGEPAPVRVIATRLDEIAERLPIQAVPFLLATPTEASGHIAAATLVERVAAYEAQGLTPWPYDAEQALLRLPWRRDDYAIVAAASLRSTTGQRLAAWLEAGPAGLVSTRHVVDGVDRRGAWYLRSEPIRSPRPAVSTHPDADKLGRIATLVLTTDPAHDGRRGWHRPWLELWPAVAPSHREAIAARALIYLRLGAVTDERGAGPVLPLLAEAEGPSGPAMILAIAYGLGAKDLTDRTAAIDAAVDLMATADLDMTRLGHEVGALCADGSIKLTRIVESLAELARIGAGDSVGDIAIACIEAVLSAARMPSGAADLMELASRHYRPAESAGIPGLADLAARTGTSRTVQEARRLHGLITATGSWR